MRTETRERWVTVERGLRRRGKTNVWQARVRGVDRNFTAPNVTAARKELTQLRVQVEAGAVERAAVRQSGSLADFVESTYWPRYSRTHRAQTNRNARLYLDSYILPALGDVALTKITRTAIESLYRGLESRMQGQSIRKVHGVLHTVLQDAVRRELITHNPATGAEILKATKKPLEVPPVSQLVEILDVIRSQDQYAIWVWLSYSFATGCRPEEVCAARWRDVHFERGEIVVAYANSRADGMNNTKNNTVRRFRIDTSTVTTLRDYRAWCEVEAAKAGVKITDASFLFSRRPEFNEPISPQNTSERFRYWRNKAGFDSFSLTDHTRRLATAVALAAGHPPIAVAARHGHSVATMLKHYAAYIPAGDAGISESLSSVLTAQA